MDRAPTRKKAGSPAWAKVSYTWLATCSKSEGIAGVEALLE